jgi:hypothetical protein
LTRSCLNTTAITNFGQRFGIEECAFIGAEALVSPNEARIIRCKER